MELLSAAETRMLVKAGGQGGWSGVRRLEFRRERNGTKERGN